jgi:hypothetical protein
MGVSRQLVDEVVYRGVPLHDKCSRALPEGRLLSARVSLRTSGP